MAKRKKIPEENPDSEVDSDTEFPFVKVARPEIGTLWDVVRRVGVAIIGGDFSGNPRGNGAIDIQVQRAHPEDVAAGENAVIFGTYARASADRSMAFGAFAATDLPDTCNFSGLIVLKANYGNTLTYLCERGAAEIIIATDVVDLAQVARHNITLPWTVGHSCSFFTSECLLVVTNHPLPEILSAPSVCFGDASDPDSLVPSVVCTHINNGHRYERFAIAWADGLTTLSASVTIAAHFPAGGQLKGRFLFKGILVEDEEA